VSALSISVAPVPGGDGAGCVIRLAGEADISTTSLRDALAAEVAAGPRLLLVEMSALTFIDSGATQMIITAYRALREQGGTLALVSPSTMVARVLGLLGVDQVIRVYGSIPEAVTSTR